MKLFLHAHATHPDASIAFALVAAQIDGQRAAQGSGAIEPTLGWMYFTDHYLPAAQSLLDDARARWPGVAWVGASGVGIAGNGVEYIDEPALVVMLGDLPRERFRVFSGVRPTTGFAMSSALVHADAGMPDLAEMIAEMAGRTETGYLFGGLPSAQSQPAVHIADGVFHGGISGVGFARDVQLVSRVTQGCQPVGPVRTITACENNVVLELDEQPALECLLTDLGIAVDLRTTDMRLVVPRLRDTLVGLMDPQHRTHDGAPVRTGQFGTDTIVRHLVGIDPARRAVVIGEAPEPGARLAYCQRDREAARRDLVRICAEIREELEPEVQTRETVLALRGHEADGLPHEARRIAGAVYVSCAGRGGPHFGAPSAELAILRHALGDVPLAGFFAGGEIASQHLYGYTGVLTVFTA